MKKKSSKQQSILNHTFIYTYIFTSSKQFNPINSFIEIQIIHLNHWCGDELETNWMDEDFLPSYIKN